MHLFGLNLIKMHIHTYYLHTYVLTYLLIHSKKQNPSWGANWFSPSLDIPRLIWNQKVHYSVYKCPLHVPIQSDINPVRGPHSTFWRSISILSSPLRLGLPSVLFPSGFFTKYFTALSCPNTCYKSSRPAHSSLFDHSKTFCEKYRSFSFSLWSLSTPLLPRLS